MRPVFQGESIYGESDEKYVSKNNVCMYLFIFNYVMQQKYVEDHR